MTRIIHATTVTTVGHSTFLSGATPSVSGIIANEWFERENGMTVTSVFDKNTRLRLCYREVTKLSNPPRVSPWRAGW